MTALKDAVQTFKPTRARKGKFVYGRRVKSSGGAGKNHNKRKVFYEKPSDRCEKHHAYKAGCGCGEKK